MTTPDSITLQRIIAKLEPQVSMVSKGNFNRDGIFRCAVRAAITKSFEFSKSAQRSHSEPFFMTATLRGICEDLIVFSFLSAFGDRDDILAAMNDENLAEGLSRQAAFFRAQRPWQPFLCDAVGQEKAVTDRLSAIARSHGWRKGGRDQIPSVRSMAVQGGLASLYDFFYSATSKWVHCCPHILLRMGWSEDGTKHSVDKDTDWIFSTGNFEKYYAEFNRIYSCFLFLLLARKFVQEFSDTALVTNLLDRMDTKLKSELRWPELVTHEELNLDTPGTLARILMRATAEG